MCFISNGQRNARNFHYLFVPKFCNAECVVFKNAQNEKKVSIAN